MVGRTAVEKNATNVVILKVDALTAVADYFILCSGNSERQVKAIADAIDGEMSRRFSSRPSVEGGHTATWILLDYGDLVIHVFREDIRAYYGIENMWRDAEVIPPRDYEPPSPLPVSTKVSPSKRAVHHY